jgi:pantetheine hydrolase
MDTPPFLAAIQFHSAVAAGLGVNFLAANMHNPRYRFQGSGIYSPEGAKAYYYNNDVKSGGKLLVSDLKILRKNLLSYDPSSNSGNLEIVQSSEIAEEQTNRSDVFHADTFGDKFNYVLLEDSSGQAKVCHNKLCCTASYASRDNLTEMYALGAFDGLHTKEGTYYIQVCGIVRCKTNEKSTCGEGSRVSNTYFTHLELSGTFRSPYVFPEILLYGDNTFKLAPPGTWSYASGKVEARNGLDLPVLSFSLFSRDYDYDLHMANSATKLKLALTATFTFLFALLFKC